MIYIEEWGGKARFSREILSINETKTWRSKDPRGEGKPEFNSFFSQMIFFLKLYLYKFQKMVKILWRFMELIFYSIFGSFSSERTEELSFTDLNEYDFINCRQL